MQPRSKKRQRMHFGGPQFEARYGLAQRPLNPSRIQRQEKRVLAYKMPRAKGQPQ
jgi:hypothetical protein